MKTINLKDKEYQELRKIIELRSCIGEEALDPYSVDYDEEYANIMSALYKKFDIEEETI